MITLKESILSQMGMGETYFRNSTILKFRKAFDIDPDMYMDIRETKKGVRYLVVGSDKHQRSFGVTRNLNLGKVHNDGFTEIWDRSANGFIDGIKAIVAEKGNGALLIRNITFDGIDVDVFDFSCFDFSMCTEDRKRLPEYFYFRGCNIKAVIGTPTPSKNNPHECLIIDFEKGNTIGSIRNSGKSSMGMRYVLSNYSNKFNLGTITGVTTGLLSLYIDYDEYVNGFKEGTNAKLTEMTNMLVKNNRFVTGGNANWIINYTYSNPDRGFKTDLIHVPVGYPENKITFA